MSVLNLVVPNADFSATGLGKFLSIPDFRNSLYAAYVFGSDFGGTGLKDHSGNGRDCTFVGTPGGIAGAIITAAGTGYTSAPTVSFSGGGGSGAAATATVSGGVVTALVMTSFGSGYTSAPAISFSGGGGSGAAATALVSGRQNDGLQCGAGFHAATSLLGTTLGAINGEVTLVTVSKAIPNVSHLLAGNYGSGGQVLTQAAGGSGLTLNKYAGYVASISAITPTADTARGSVFEFCGTTHAPAATSVYAKKGPAGVEQYVQGTGTASGTFGGNGYIKFGESQTSPFNVPCPKIAAALVYVRGATQAEFRDVVYPGLQAQLAKGGISI